MKILPFKLPKSSDESFVVEHNVSNHLYNPLHQHPELQITLILQGTGTAFIGGYIGDFKPNDIFVIGSDVPHVFKNDDTYFDINSDLKAEVIYVFFDQNSFGDVFFKMPEAKDLDDLFNRARKGIKVHGEVKTILISKLHDLASARNMEKIIRLLDVFQIICAADSLEYLSTEVGDHNVDEHEGKRLNDVIQFTMEKYYRHISLDEISDIANLTPAAFCRFFKQRTRKTYVNFLNEIRIGKACRMLLDKDMSIVDICYKSGFSNLSHFNRKFKKQTGYTPSKYKQALSQSN
ncbi:AraC family transcriptional regulator [Reichenbachiella sp. MALMAid0571]|uniref:AraC family transcriptional regulator n=1 Tax=Reichenbachiella sp. MALMAid0571 TaxID=3143939 RepID=UPI0032DE2CD0